LGGRFPAAQQIVRKAHTSGRNNNFCSINHQICEKARQIGEKQHDSYRQRGTYAAAGMKKMRNICK
jgi:hypothetical protein